ncbi:hypothetical protein GCM10027275_50230 [Rhabdobacter roseus]|uniref:Single-stranded DNA-binding protein n=1 Tax=Rhabdobacter roseus TaxID=1655419 RepID=A0A840TVZ7_9BACT|nr:single-stranded DNA-binding protein [Rhabdobacter roseus]MBB5287095.1 single-strand DNA-binding protein [Rhabdobacter roseus]
MKQIQIIGHLGRDARKHNTNGREFLAFTVAVTEKWKDAAGQKQERTDWFSVISQQLTLAPYLAKGTQVYVQGPLQAKPYRNETSGQWGVDLSISADKIQLLSSNKDAQSRPAAPAAGTSEPLPWEPAPVGTQPGEDGVPF